MEKFKLNSLRVLVSALIIFIIAVSMGSCGNSVSKKDKIYTHHNFIILLDLSDRIIEPGQLNKDMEVIEILWNQFRSISKKKLFIHSRDVFQIVVAEQDSSSLDPISKRNFQDSLNLDLSTFKRNEKQIFARNKKRVDEFGSQLNKRIENMYEQASLYSNPNDYRGADIFRFFNEDISKRLIKDYKNHVFILTDGELYVKNGGGVFKEDFPSTSFQKNDFDIDVCMLEVTTTDRNTLNKLHKEWSQWYKGMGINELGFQKSDDNSSIEKVVKDFLFADDRRQFQLYEHEVQIKTPIVSDDNGRPTQIEQQVTQQVKKKEKKDPLIGLNNQDFVDKYITKDLDSDNDVFKKQRLQRLRKILESDFPEKNTTNYSIVCSYKTLILSQMSKNKIDISLLKDRFNDKCPVI